MKKEERASNRELRPNRPPAFHSEDEDAMTKNLTRPEVARKAFLAAYYDKLTDEQKKMLEEME